MTRTFDPGAVEKARGKTRHIGFLIFPGMEILDLCGPLDVFAYADGWLRSTKPTDQPFYSIQVLAMQAGVTMSSSGVRLVVDRAVAERDQDFDTLIVAGGLGIELACRDAALVDWIKSMAPRVRRLASVCNGALLLARAGILDGRRATTHWAYCQRLASSYPLVEVDPDRIFVRDGHIYTSGGITAGIDLALAMLEEDHGNEIARLVAQMLVVFLRRPGGQSQFSTYLASEARRRADICDLQAWVMTHLRADLSAEAMADRMAMSLRTFARTFKEETGTTPAKFVERARVEGARLKLEQSLLSIDEIAEVCGFGDSERMRRSFNRTVGVSPQDYRSRFMSTKGKLEEDRTACAISPADFAEGLNILAARAIADLTGSKGKIK